MISTSIIVRQMMTKVEIVDGGDTQFLEGSLEHKNDFIEENERVFGLKVVINPGDSKEFKAGQMITARELRDENSKLKREDQELVEVREALPATAQPVLQGITEQLFRLNPSCLQLPSRKLQKYLTSAVSGKVDDLNGLKENVIVGHRIPAGTGLKQYQNIIVGSTKEFEDIN